VDTLLRVKPRLLANPNAIVTSAQFLWGLSNGVTVLAIAGTFWLGLGLGQPAANAGWLAWWTFLALWLTSSAMLLWGAVRLRRRSGFQRSDLRKVDPRQQAETCKILRGFGWVVFAQTIVVSLLILLCVRARREDWIWPAIGLVVSLHFAPLGRILHVRLYYATALAGTSVSLLAFIVPTGSHQLALFCSAMAFVMWGSAVYLIAKANRVAERAIRERWAS
jgi:hypothetical protein